MATRPFPVDARLTAIALAYRNPDIALIADEVLPLTPVSVEFTATEQTDRVVDHALADFIPNEDLEDDNQGVDPRGTAVAYLTNLVNLAREIRAAGLVFNTASYVAANQTTLSSGSQWNESGADPVAAIGDALDIPVYRPNIAVFGQAAWTKTRRHPKLVQAIKGTAQGAGMVSRQEFADFFELSAIYVGAGFVNTAKKGQTVATARVWGKHASFLYRDRAAGPQAGVTFGFTGQAGSKMAGSIAEPKRGYSGGEEVRVGHRVKEIVCATDLGYWFQNCVA